MRFLADECVGGSLVRSLRQSGFDVEWIREFAFGATDEQVLEHSNQTSRILITEDYDFADLIFRFRKRALAVIIIAANLADRPIAEKAPLVAGRLQKFGNAFVGRLTILEKDRTRQRDLPD